MNREKQWKSAANATEFGKEFWRAGISAREGEALKSKRHAQKVTAPAAMFRPDQGAGQLGTKGRLTWREVKRSKKDRKRAKCRWNSGGDWIPDLGCQKKLVFLHLKIGLGRSKKKGI